ncbi:MAG: FISUMP domain-containing protein [Bacteroidales bacterium]
MKRTIILLTASFITISAFSQQFACKQDTVHFYQTNYRGKLSWQKSENGTDWSQLPGSQSDTLMVVATSPAYYRTEVIEGLCKPYYSDIIHLIVNQLPTITLTLKDSVCLNETPFVLDGGVPSGGSYWGNGVIDGKFSPAFAGAGEHKVYYRYSDSQTGCADTAYAFITVSPVTNHAQAGNDLTFVPADSVLLDANIPENGIGTWTVINGSNGHFSDIHSPKAWFLKDSNNLDFTLRWSISGNCGNSSDDVAITFFPLSKNPCPNAPTVTDADGNVYPTIQIGDQCWMGKNLNVGRFVTSTVSNTVHSDLTNNNIIERYCFDNKVENCKLYGGLYDWNEAMNYSEVENTQGICPEGWHIPGNGDWANLNDFFKTFTAGELLKVGGSSGFEGYFAGDRHAMGEFYSMDASGFWWQSASYIYDNIDEGYLREIEACNGNLTRTHFPKKTGLSVRCIKNN